MYIIFCCYSIYMHTVQYSSTNTIHCILYSTTSTCSMLYSFLFNCLRCCLLFSVLPLSMHFAPLTVKSQENKVKLDKFYASIKSRLIVAEVIAGIRAGTQARTTAGARRI